MSFHMNCLLCKPGTKWHPPAPQCGSTDLVAIQEHAMQEHGVTQDDLRKQSSVVLAPNHYIYSLPDGRQWLDAKRIEQKPIRSRRYYHGFP